MQQDFYTVEGLSTQLLGSAFVNLNNIPDFRLKSMLHILEMTLSNLEGQKLETGQREENSTARSRLGCRLTCLVTSYRQTEGCK